MSERYAHHHHHQPHRCSALLHTPLHHFFCSWRLIKSALYVCVNSAVYLAVLVLIGICCVALSQVLMPAQTVMPHPVGRLNWLLLQAVLHLHRTPSGHYDTASCSTSPPHHGACCFTSELAPAHLSPSMPACPPIPQLAHAVHPYSSLQTLSIHTSAGKSCPCCASGHPDLPSSSRARQPVLRGLRHQHGSQRQRCSSSRAAAARSLAHSRRHQVHQLQAGGQACCVPTSSLS